MKKFLSCFLLILLLISLLCGCNQNKTIFGNEVIEEEIPNTDGYHTLYAESVELGECPDMVVPLADSPFNYYVLNPIASGVDVQQNESAIIDYSNKEEGYVMVGWLKGGKTKIKVCIDMPNEVRYTYNLKTDGSYEVFPLSGGNGEYTIKVYKNTRGTKYAVVLTQTFTVTLTDEFAPFIRPNQYVNFNEDSEVVKLASELCLNAKDNIEKVESIYNYVVDNLTYDNDKARNVPSDYLPDLDAVLAAKKGICFDYASVMTAMLRSQGVPTKLVVGYTGKAYHAWINVWSEKEGWIDSIIFFDGKNWKLMDPTFASSSHNSESIIKYIGNGSNYTAKYLY